MSETKINQHDTKETTNVTQQIFLPDLTDQ